MFVSIRWIREFCPFELVETPRELAARFSLHGAEVEHAAPWCPGIESIRIARILELRPHPQADKLRLVRIALEEGRSDEIVCGAPNAREGLLVPFAPVGTVLGGREIRDIEVRGVRSCGMLCSAKELGVSEDGAGLWELPSTAPMGGRLLELYPELDDLILEIDNKSVTHRPDLWGHHGLAREFSTIFRTPLAPLEADASLGRAAGRSSIRVSIEGDGVGGPQGLCRRYCGLEIRGVSVGPSPTWLQHRLLAVGGRPVNNLVDVTNLILYETGQPLHSFDASRLAGGEIRVRRAAEGERLRLLDGSDVALEREDCVIADRDVPVALAGVMGGAGSEISAETTVVFLESANFAPARVRRTSVRVGKRTDSSLRFEKSLDPELAKVSILRAAKYILDLCPGARVVGRLQDVGYEAAPPIEISTSAERIGTCLGTEIPVLEVRGALERLGFKVSGKDTGTWKVRVPSWRATKDVSIEADLIEEVGRIHGYDRIEPRAPTWKVEAPTGNPHRRMARAAKQFLALQGGLSEVFTYSMVGEAHCRFFGLDPEAHLKLRNPMSEDMDRMRREIVPLHLEKARDNQRYFKDFGFFEFGRVYRKPIEALSGPGLPDERTRAVGLLSRAKRSPENFQTLRGIVLGLLEWLRVREPRIEGLEAGAVLESWVHPSVVGRVLLEGTECGRIYGIHPAIEGLLELEGETLAFDLDLDLIVAAASRGIRYEPPLRYPSVPFDVAVTAESRTPVRAILRVIEVAAGELLLSSRVFDVFRGEQSGKDRKSVAIHMELGSRDHTLRGEEISLVETRVTEALEAAGYPLRT